jgi:hypothetical protein
MSKGPTATFEARVDRWVRTAVSEVASFDELVSRLPGVYPPAVAQSLERVLRCGTISKRDHARATGRDPAAGSKRRVRGPQILPAPHPLDYDWRYGNDAIDRLLELAIARSAPGDTIALLGTPSLYVAAHHRCPDRRFVLIDGNATTVDRLRGLGRPRSVIHRDLFVDRVPHLGATVVVADPPWYEDHISVFLWAAASCSSPGSTVLISLPAKGTRPGVHSERKAFRTSAAAQSLTVGRMVGGHLPYVSPPFEINALRVAGWEHLPHDWRRGDLAVLRSAGSPGTRPMRATREHRWEERSLGSVRIRIRRGSRDHGADPTLGALVDGDVLADVSRRHPLRDRPNVWTTGNRVYLCSSPHSLLTVVDAVLAGSNPSSHVASTIGRELTRAEEASISKTVNQLRWLARIEGRELAQHGWISHSPLVERSAS